VNVALLRLAARIRDELPELARLVERAQQGWQRAQRSGDQLYLDGVALNLHGFYAGLERLFGLIASGVHGDLPQGANWHQVLLHRMACEAPGVRPAVISASAERALEEYRGFRHVVRHLYTFQMDPARMERLAEQAPLVLAQVSSDLTAFAEFLEVHAQAAG
jgi:hypothetical protein